MNKKMQNKKNYLTPKVSVVKFMVESGFAGSDPVRAFNPISSTETSGPQYTVTSDGGFTSDFQYINQ